MSQLLRPPNLSGYALALGCVLLVVLLGQTKPKVDQEPAQLHDAGAQRNAMIVELRASNQKLTEIAALLKQIRDQDGPKAAEADKPERPPR